MHLDSAGPKLCVPEVLAASDIFLAKQPLLPDGPAGAMEQKITVANELCHWRLPYGVTGDLYGVSVCL